MDRRQTDLAVAALERRIDALCASDLRPWLYWQLLEPEANAILQAAPDPAYAIAAINTVLARHRIRMTVAANR
jgi:hypothetical protein